MRKHRNTHPIPARNSPKGGRRGCLCNDNTYHVDCCTGSLSAQGIGRITAITETMANYEIKHESLAGFEDVPLVVTWDEPFTTVPTLLVQAWDGGEWVELALDALNESGFTVTPAFDCIIYYVAIETISS